jgi:hypothetical protein
MDVGTLGRNVRRIAEWNPQVVQEVIYKTSQRSSKAQQN